MESIAVPIITGVLTLIGVCITAWASAKKTRDDVTTKLQLAQAVMNEKIENLRKSVDKHNGFAERLPKLEQRVDDLEKQTEK